MLRNSFLFSGRPSQSVSRTGSVMLVLLLLVALPEIAEARNFVSPDPAITNAAEAARHRSALFWSGAPLPGNWSSPCPILVVPALHSGSGKTQFQIEGGEVFGWRMEISGHREALIRDVIPHEVDHMVRVSLVRRRIERWLDEGCATLMESPEVHQQLRTTARAMPPELITAEWLNAMEYPTTSAATANLYALGFSIVEFLLTRNSPEVLLAFQRETDSVESRLYRHYGLTIPTLREEWRKWRHSLVHASCREGWCPIHGQHPIIHPAPSAPFPESRPILAIWTAEWCPPCRQFKADFWNMLPFRQALESAFQIEWRDYDRNTSEAIRNGIESLPTFILNRGSPQQLNGYSDPTELLQRLGLSPLQNLPPSHSNEETSPSTPQPDISEVGEETPSVPAPLESSPEETSDSPQMATPPPQPRGQFWMSVMTFSVLQWMGVIGGSAATGGAAGVALSLLSLAWRRRQRRRSRTSPNHKADHLSERRERAIRAPFPRELDEARELLELRKTEGRVATLDTLRGMFLDDELEKLVQNEPESAQLIEKLRNAIDARVDEVAPLTT